MENKESQSAGIFAEYKKAITKLSGETKFDERIASMEYNGMDPVVIYQFITEVSGTETGRKHLSFVVAWALKAGGNPTPEKIAKFSLASEMTEAVNGLKIVVKRSGPLPKEAMTVSRICFGLHPLIVEKLVKLSDKIKPFAGVDFGMNFAEYTALFNSTFAPYAYSSVADPTNVVKAALLEWAYQHHNTVNPAKKAKERVAFNRSIFDAKLTGSIVSAAMKGKFTSAVLVVLQANSYAMGTVFSDAWKTHSKVKAIEKPQAELMNL